MRKFILIDHSIKGYGGHHYEYAYNVLQAARAAGFEPMLAVHRAFALSAGAPEWPIIPAYDHGFWQAPAVAASSSWDGLWQKWFGLKTRIKYSPAGLVYLAVPLLANELTPQQIIAQIRHPLRMLGLLMACGLIRYPVLVWRALKSLLWTIVQPASNYFQRVGERFYHLGKELLYPFRILLHLGRIRRRFERDTLQGAFGEGTRRALAGIELNDGDLVFIPTLSERDMLGLLDYFRTAPESARPAWHLLFRRNLYQGRESEYAGQEQNVAVSRDAFRQFCSALTGQQVTFWTDTERLTDQYNRLGVAEFRTLPIPINEAFHRLSPRHVNGDGLRIVYAGDARREKGYPYLPQIVGGLLRDPEFNRKVRFEFQSNFAHARPEDGTDEMLARTELDCMQSDRVRLHLNPLDSDAYFKLVSSADILLVLYDPKNYYARSSGVMIEALAAGIPVVAPRDSWMGQLLAEATHRHCLDLRQRGRVLAAFELADLNWSRQGERIREGHQLICGDHAARVETFIPMLPETTHVLVLFDRPAESAHAVRVHLSQLRRSRLHDLSPEALAVLPELERYIYDGLASESRMVCPSPECERCGIVFPVRSPDLDAMWIGAWNAFGSEAVRLGRMEIVLLQSDGAPIHEEAVGVSYENVEAIEDQLRYLVRHYEHFRQTAIEHARRIGRRHSAQRLVEVLAS